MSRKDLARRLARVSRQLCRLLEEALETDEPDNLQPMEQAILDALVGKTLPGKQIASRSGYSYGARIRLVLADMTRRGLLTHGPDGYRRATSDTEQEP